MTSFQAPITVLIPTIAPREVMLERAVRSVYYQTVGPAGGVRIHRDDVRLGSAITRNAALPQIETEWVAFLDDDDMLHPYHLQVLFDAALDTGADVIYPGCEVVANGVLLPHERHNDDWGRFGRPFDPDTLRDHSCIPVTSLVRTEVAQAALFGPPAGVNTPYDDWGFYLRCLDQGASFHHVPVRTWTWFHWEGNTSGQPDRW